MAQIPRVFPPDPPTPTPTPRMTVDPKLEAIRKFGGQGDPPPTDPFSEFTFDQIQHARPIKLPRISEVNPIGAEESEALAEFMEEKSVATLAKKLARLGFAPGVIAEHLDIFGRPLNRVEPGTPNPGLPGINTGGTTKKQPIPLSAVSKLSDSAIAKLLNGLDVKKLGAEGFARAQTILLAELSARLQGADDTAARLASLRSRQEARSKAAIDAARSVVSGIVDHVPMETRDP